MQSIVCVCMSQTYIWVGLSGFELRSPDVRRRHLQFLLKKKKNFRIRWCMRENISDTNKEIFKADPYTEKKNTRRCAFL